MRIVGERRAFSDNKIYELIGDVYIRPKIVVLKAHALAGLIPYISQIDGSIWLILE